MTALQVPLAPGWRPWNQFGGDTVRALTHGPLLLRSRSGYGRRPARWHRPRTGHDYGRHVAWEFWCGQSSGRVIFGDRLPDGELLCGACEGRAVGAGWPTLTGIPAATVTFTPPILDLPNPCPGSKGLVKYSHYNGDWWLDLPGGRSVECLYCGSVEKITGGSRGYGWTAVGPAAHEPVSLIAPCPDHGWFSMARWEDVLVCRCQMVEVEVPRDPAPSIVGGPIVTADGRVVPGFNPPPDDDLGDGFDEFFGPDRPERLDNR